MVILHKTVSSQGYGLVENSPAGGCMVKNVVRTSKPAVRTQIDISIGEIPRSHMQARKHFEVVAEEIIGGWVHRRRTNGGLESAHTWFKRNMYRLIKAYVDDQRSGVFITMARLSGRSLVGLPKIQGNPFKLALFAMWEDNQSLTRHQQRVFGTQMFYAYLHGVTPEHLIGFIRTAGSAQTISKKLKKGAREPGFPSRATSRQSRGRN